jgi:hypothetical protein
MRARALVASGDSGRSVSLSWSTGFDLRRRKEGEVRLEDLAVGDGATMASWMVIDGTAVLGDRVRVGTAVLLMVAFAMAESRLRSLLDCDVWRVIVSSMAATIVFLASPGCGACFANILFAKTAINRAHSMFLLSIAYAYAARTRP